MLSVLNMSRAEADSRNVAYLQLKEFTPPDVAQEPETSTSDQSPAQGHLVTQQPTSGNARPLSNGTADLQGLNMFATVDNVRLEQKLDMCQVFCKIRSETHFSGASKDQEDFYSVKESSNCCMRLLSGIVHPFKMTIVDNAENIVLHLRRPLAGQGFLWPCHLQELDVLSSTFTLLGTIKEDWTLASRNFTILNAAGDAVLSIKGPCCTFFCGTVHYEIISLGNERRVGVITKHYSGCCKEFFTTADRFSASFDMDLPVKLKALIVSALQLINAMYYERLGCFY